MLALKATSKEDVCWSLPEPYTTQLVRYVIAGSATKIQFHFVACITFVRSNSAAISLGQVAGKLRRRCLSALQIPFKLQREAHQGCVQQNAPGTFTAKDWRVPAAAGVGFETGADFAIDPH